MKKRTFLFLCCLFLSLGMAVAQTKVTGGVIYADDGSPVIGATVRVVGHNNIATVTDSKGEFTLTLPKGANQVTASYVGMVSKAMNVTGKYLTIALQLDATNLDEVMVIGYGTAKKSAFTGSATEIKAEDISGHVASSATSALVGKVAGVSMTTSSGAPGSSATLRIRGIGSMQASSAPLYIVDGAPWDGAISDINPSDIESISVLKDASASAIYGARGANGVVIITTKRAKGVQDAQITFEAKIGSNSRLVPQYDVIDNPGQYYETHYRALYNSKIYNGATPGEAYAFADAALLDANNGGLGYLVYTVPEGEKLIGTNFKLNPNATLGYSDGEYFYTPDNWYDETFHNSFRQEYNMSITGASEKLNYYAGFNFLDDGGSVDKSNYKRYTARTNLEYQVTKYIKLVTNMAYTHTNSESPMYGSTWGSSGNLFYICNTMAPIYPLYVRNADGSLKTQNGLQVYDSNQTGFKRPSVVGNAVRDNVYNSDKTYSDLFAGTWGLVVTPIEGLTLSANISLTSSNSRNNYLGSVFGSASDSDGYAYASNGRLFSTNQTYMANYVTTIADVHSINIMAGYEQYNYKGQSISGSNDHLYNPFIGELNNALGSDAKQANSSTNHYMTEGFLGRVQYDYNDKYFFSASFRRDASSVFAPGHRWGNFGSVGLAWQINKEKFLEDVKWIDLLKFKVSYGEQGNDNLLSGGSRDYQIYADRYSTNYNKETGEYSVNMIRKGNEDITWETSKSFNIGLDFSFFDYRLNGTIEYYNRKTTDMLYFKTLPLSSGYSVSGYPTNIGEMVNRGIEFSVDGTIIRTNDIEWGLNLNVTHNENEILSLGPSIDKGGLKYGSYIIREGGSYYQAYMVKYAGTDKETGLALYYMDKDVTNEAGEVIGTEMVTTTDLTKADQYDLGTTMADLYGGFGTTFKAYGFDLSAQFSFQLGGKIYDGEYQALMHNGHKAGYAMHKDLLDAWSPENNGSDIPRLSTASTDFGSSQTAIDRFLTSSDYLSLTNLTVGYTLPKKLVNALELSNVRVYFAGENLFLLTARKGLDPRFNYGIGSMTSGSGMQSSSYAGMRSITGGISVTF